MKELFVRTINNMGYQANELDPVSHAFVDYAAAQGKNGKWSLDIGCAYGAASLPALERGAKLYCNDLSEKHFDSFPDFVKKFETRFIAGDFRQADIPHDYFYAALCSRVLHFLTPKEVLPALRNIKDFLVTQGKLFLVVETPFLGNWKTYLPEYNLRKKSKHLWPGFIEYVAEIESSGHKENLPSYMHFFDIDTLVRVLCEVGFTIEEITYVDRKGQFPDDLLLDGRESIGVIASKVG